MIDARNGAGNGDGDGDGDKALPWLEAVDDEDGARGMPARKMLAAVLLVAVAVALVAASLFWLGRRDGTAAAGPPELIRAEPGPYKVKPGDPGGLDVAGDSGTAFATSAGEDSDGQIDLDAVPEAPIERPAKAPAPAPGPAKRLPPNETREPVRDETARPPKPPAAPTVPAGGAGSIVQLGAFSSAAKAEAAWSALSGRFALVAAMGKMVVPVRSGSATLYRLRAAAGSPADARQACRTLRVAGESCVVVN